MPRSLVTVVTLFAACTEVSSGTFVGNPSLTAEYESTRSHQATGGRFEASSVLFTPCDSNEQAVMDGFAIEFLGGRGGAAVQIPPGEFCEARFPVSELSIGWRTSEGGDVTVTARDFDLTIQARFEAREDEPYTLRLGGPDWLDELAAVADGNDITVSSAEMEFQDAFFSGLEQDSEFAASQGGGDPSSLAGRLTLEDFDASPGGVPTPVSGCTAGQTVTLAVPIPPAAMATMDRFEAEPGWCVGDVRFDEDPSVRFAVQQDYSDTSTFTVPYNGWGSECDALHCAGVRDSGGVPLDRACTVFAVCEASGGGRVTGFGW